MTPNRLSKHSPASARRRHQISLQRKRDAATSPAKNVVATALDNGSATAGNAPPGVVAEQASSADAASTPKDRIKKHASSSSSESSRSTSLSSDGSSSGTSTSSDSTSSDSTSSDDDDSVTPKKKPAPKKKPGSKMTAAAAAKKAAAAKTSASSSDDDVDILLFGLKQQVLGPAAAIKKAKTAQDAPAANAAAGNKKQQVGKPAAPRAPKGAATDGAKDDSTTTRQVKKVKGGEHWIYAWPDTAVKNVVRGVFCANYVLAAGERGNDAAAINRFLACAPQMLPGSAPAFYSTAVMYNKHPRIGAVVLTWKRNSRGQRRRLEWQACQIHSVLYSDAVDKNDDDDEDDDIEDEVPIAFIIRAIDPETGAPVRFVNSKLRVARAGAECVRLIPLPVALPQFAPNDDAAVN